MTPEHIRIVQSTWLRVLPIKEQAAQWFYDRLFELDPSLKRLFRSDIRSQGQKLMEVIDGAVYGLNRFDKMVPIIQALGRRHAGYGVEDRHYGTVGSALLWTLEQGLGAAFTPQVKDAWTAVYAALATTMREAASAAATRQADDRVQPAAVVPEEPSPARGAWGIGSGTRLGYVAAALGLLAAIGWSLNMTANGTPAPSASPPAPRAPIAAAPDAAVEPARFLLNALLVPALEPEALPLRWVDPRRAMRCGPNTSIHVNGERLMPGALVPNMPFELTWHAEDCRPFGKAGPRIAGHVKFTVFREDWGFSAMVEPGDLRVVSGNNQPVWIEAGATTLPSNPADLDRIGANAPCEQEGGPCR